MSSGRSGGAYSNAFALSIGTGSPAEKELESRREGFDVPQFALPNHKNAPPCSLKVIALAQVPVLVCFQFRQPVIQAAFWGLADPTAVGMPEAAVDENYAVTAGKDNVGRAGQVLAVQTEAITQRVKQRPDNTFWGCVAAFDRLH